MKKPIPRSDTIFDLGLHRGEDTAYYLKKGFRVIAVEANRELVEHCRRRFAIEISSGSLTIIEGAIAPPSAGEELTFYLNPNSSIWGTLYADRAQRRAETRGTAIAPCIVRRVDLGEMFLTYGVPHYLKVDLEGADEVIYDPLRALDQRPPFVSLEKTGACLEPLFDLGYRQFRIIMQGKIFGKKLEIRTRSGALLDYTFEEHSSGPFGEDLDLPWVEIDECKKQADKIKRLRDFWKTAAPKEHIFPAWYDTHARLG